MRVALVHDWLVTNRGGEKVLDALCELFPGAELYTLIHREGSVSARIEARPIHTSFLQRIPGIERRYRNFLPLMPAAIESFQLRGYDLVVSSSHCVAKGIRVPRGARHVSYVHAPMRYMWDLFDDYFGPGRASAAVRTAARGLRPLMQRWDRRSARRVDRFVANSRHVAHKIERFYGRSAQVVHPPVELERFTGLPLEGSGQGGYFLWFSAIVPYKRLDIALEAFAELPGHRLVIAGAGEIDRPLPANVEHRGPVPDADVPRLLRDARALVFTADEDFGITPLEAQACGRPVIALGRGGALETVTPATGYFFPEQTAASLAEAVRAFDRWESTFDPALARANAERFSRARFLAQMREQIHAAGRQA